MELGALQSMAGDFINGLPDKIRDTLEDVEILMAEDPSEGTAELLASLEDPDKVTVEQKALCTLPVDCKGAFIGDPMEREESEEDPEEETIYDPDGVIVLVASNIASRDEFVLVMLHEMGHALGLDEDGVKALGLAVSQAAQAAQAQKGPADATPSTSDT
jgi:predicted Zn-dependent protease with MMP-like domain